MESNIDNIKLRSEEVQEILSNPPRKIFFWGNLVFVMVIIIIFGGIFIIQKNSYHNSEIVFITSIPVDKVESFNEGFIQSLNIKNNQEVKKNESLITLNYLDKDTIIISSTDGKINFFNYLFVGKKIKKGEDLFSIIPNTNNIIKGVVLLNSSLSADVKKGEIIKFEFVDYPKIGQIKGVANNKSISPNREGNYYTEIDFSYKEKQKINDVISLMGNNIFKIKINIDNSYF